MKTVTVFFVYRDKLGVNKLSAYTNHNYTTLSRVGRRVSARERVVKLIRKIFHPGCPCPLVKILPHHYSPPPNYVRHSSENVFVA